jgi:CPA2 family monovalent cation:H+ antiporter-2
MILGVTVVGDIFIAVYLAIVSVVLSGKTEVWPVVIQLVTAFFFLVAMFGLARFGGKVVSRLLRTRDEELFTILFFGLALLFGGIGEAIGVSDAIGAFLIGLVLGATTMSGRIERVAVPLRDVFAAFFFVNFGLGLNVAEFPSVIGVVLLAVAMTFVLNVISGLAIAKMYGFHLAEGINASAILVNRGEFTLILATLSVAAGLNDLLTPFAGLYVLIMAVLGPVFAANSERLGALLGTKKARSRTAVPNSMHAEEIALVDAVTDDDPERTQRAIDRMVEQAMSAEAPDGEEGDDH